MSDVIPSSLIDQLATQGGREVFLPAEGTTRTDPVSTAYHAAEPAVIEIAKSYFSDPEQLHNSSVGAATIVREKAIHRSMIYLHAAGASLRDIADQTGFSYAAVRTILSQPWARERLVQILKETGRDRVKHFLTHEVAPSLEILKEIRDDRNAKEAARIAAANSILDRALGKATVIIESTNTTRNVPVEAARIDAELASVRKQLADRGLEDATPHAAN